MRIALLFVAIIAIPGCNDHSVIKAKDKEIAELKAKLNKCNSLASSVDDQRERASTMGAAPPNAQPPIVRGGFSLDPKGQLDRITSEDRTADIKQEDRQIIATLGMPMETREDLRVLEIANNAISTWDQVAKGGEHNAGRPIVLRGTISDIREQNGGTIAKVMLSWNKYFYVLGRFTSSHVKHSRVEIIGYSALTNEEFEDLPVVAAAAILKEGGLAKIRAAYKAEK